MNNVTIQAGLTLAAITIGQRVYLIRLACGDGVRKAMPMREFAELLSRKGETFHPSRVSDIENDKSPPTINEAQRIAEVDPQKRGPAWIAFGGQPEQQLANGHQRPRVENIEDPPASPPPLEMFKRLETGDDLRDGLGEPRAEKKKRGNGRHEAS